MINSSCFRLDPVWNLPLSDHHLSALKMWGVGSNSIIGANALSIDTCSWRRGPGSMKVPELKDAIGSNVLTMFVLRMQKRTER
jgi:hypothetical protein